MKLSGPPLSSRAAPYRHCTHPTIRSDLRRWLRWTLLHGGQHVFQRLRCVPRGGGRLRARPNAVPKCAGAVTAAFHVRGFPGYRGGVRISLRGLSGKSLVQRVQPGVPAVLHDGHVLAGHGGSGRPAAVSRQATSRVSERRVCCVGGGVRTIFIWGSSLVVAWSFSPHPKRRLRQKQKTPTAVYTPHALGIQYSEHCETFCLDAQLSVEESRESETCLWPTRPTPYCTRNISRAESSYT